MSVPEPEKGREDVQDEEVPEPVLLIRLDEADALIHLKSMVSRLLSPYSTSLCSSPFHFASSVTGLRRSTNFVLSTIFIEFLESTGVVLLITGICFFLDGRERQRDPPETGRERCRYGSHHRELPVGDVFWKRLGRYE